MKKIVAILLAFSLIFCFTSCAKEKTENPDTETTASAENVSNNNAADGNNSVELLSVYSKHEYSSREGEGSGFILSEVNYETLYLSDEDEQRYPSLAKAIGSMNKEETARYEECADELAVMCDERFEFTADTDDEPIPYTAYLDYFICRADNVVLSLRVDTDVYSGTAYPNYCAEGYNYDTATGKKLVITDVMNDISSLPSILSEKIMSNEKYKDEVYGNPEEVISEYTVEDYLWTVGYNGVTFYLNPFEVAPYSAGVITATVYFDEYPELFNKKYTVAPEAYATGLPDGRNVEFDLNPADGKRDTINVGLSDYEDELYEDITVALNGSEFTVEDVFALSAEFYLVNSKCKYYVYLVTHSFNDYTDILVYDLNGGKIKECGIVGRTDFGKIVGDDYYSKYIFNNPSEFVLETTFDVLSTYSAAKTYTVNSETGMPESTDEFYTVDKSFPHVLTSKEAFNVKILPDMKTELVKVGSEFTLLRTDGETYVDAKLGDGRECRINVERDEESYQLLIGGKSENDVFENVYYAG